MRKWRWFSVIPFEFVHFPSFLLLHLSFFSLSSHSLCLFYPSSLLFTFPLFIGFFQSSPILFSSFPSLYVVPQALKLLVMWYYHFLKLSFNILLFNRQRGRLESMIRQLVPEREKIGEAMVWCIEHADAAEEICQCITEALTNTETALPKKVSLLW